MFKIDIAKRFPQQPHPFRIFCRSKTFPIPKAVSLVAIVAHGLIFYILESTSFKPGRLLSTGMNSPNNMVSRQFSTAINDRIRIALFQQVFLHGQIHAIAVPNKDGVAFLDDFIQNFAHFRRKFRYGL